MRIIRRIDSIPRLRTSFHLEPKKEDWKDTSKLTWTLKDAAKRIASANKTSGKFGSRQAKSAITRTVSVSIVPDQDETDPDLMDIDLPPDSFQDSLKDKSTRVSS